MKAYWGIGVALLSLAEAAGAQTDLPERRVDIDLSTRLLYDSNVLRTPDAAIEPATYKRSDFRVTPAINLDILLPVSRQSLFLNGTLGYDFYQRNTQLNRERLSLAAGANLTAGGSCASTVTGTYVRQQSDLADLFNNGPLRSTEERGGYGVRLDCGSAIGLQPGGGYRHESVKNSTAERQRNDYTTDTFDADIGYARPTFGTLSVFGTYSDSSYPNRIVLGAEDGVRVYSTGIRYQREIGSRLRGTVSGGYTWVKPKLPGTGEFNGVSYSADLTYTPTERLQLTIGFARDAQLSNLLDISYSIAETYHLDGEYAFGQRIRLLFGTSFTDRQFELSPLFPSPIQRTGDKRYQGYLGVRYAMSRRLSFDVDFTQDRRDSDNRLFDYRSSRVGLTARLTI